MHKFLLTALLASLSASAFALFPVQTDWQANHLQGKVKSVISHSEDNPDAVEGEVVTNDVRQFYNEQGFLIKTEEITQESEFSYKTTANYRYDQNNRLEEIRYDIYKETLPLSRKPRWFRRHFRNHLCRQKAEKTEFSRRLHQKSLRQRWQTHL